MASWAAVASAGAPQRAPAVTTVPEGNVLVVDANAIIAGVQLDRLAQTPVTVPEVLREVRDSDSRARLASLPFGLETQEPNDESMKAVTRFARATGDLGTLSKVDLRLIALTHTLHTAVHGEAGLRSAPAPPVVLARKPRTATGLPGWGDTGDTWDALDSIPDNEAGGADSDSRIAAALERLEVGRQQGDSGDNSDAGSSEGEGEDGDDGWEVAAKSHNAARRHKRKAAKRAAWEQYQQQLLQLHHAQQAEPEPAAPAPPTPRPAAAGRQSEQAMGAGDAAPASAPSSPAPLGSESDSDDSASADGSGGSVGEEEAEEEEQGGGGGGCVSIITADFAMQNVVLQMGLRLVAPNGLRITQLNRWVLRCAACATVTKEVGRIFCPRCGNSTLERVHVVVGPDGAETYGVRRKHVLKGTRFSLPKPRGGRNSKDAVLSEDVLMHNTQRLQRSLKKKEEVDPFAPEYGADSWFRANATNTVPAAQQQQLAQAAGMSALLASWKHNPNDRRGVHRTNRRK